MELEERYIVLKVSDVQRLDPKAQAQLHRLVAAHDFAREIRGVGPVRALVVEHDWPEYERTKESILRRAAADAHSPRWYWWDVLGIGMILVGLIVAFVK